MHYGQKALCVHALLCLHSLDRKYNPQGHPRWTWCESSRSKLAHCFLPQKTETHSFNFSPVITLFLPCIASGCGGPEVLNGTGGTVSSMGFPGSYSNNAKCHWIIHAPPGKLVHLHFHNFSLEESQLCMNDRLRIADGTGALGLWITVWFSLMLLISLIIRLCCIIGVACVCMTCHSWGCAIIISLQLFNYEINKHTDFGELPLTQQGLWHSDLYRLRQVCHNKAI